MNPNYIIEICVAIDIAILGIAYPIIIDKISSIGDKYKSQYVPVLFNKEFPQRQVKLEIGKWGLSISIFKLTLFITLLSFSFLIFKFPPWFGWNNWFINNSAEYLVLATSVTLTIFFIIWLDKVMLYNGKSTSLLSALTKKYFDSNERTETKGYTLKAINELTFYAIEKQDEHLQETLLDFYFKVFSEIRRNSVRDIPLEFPIDLYFLVNKLNFEVTETNNKRLRAIEHRAVSGVWLLGEDLEEIPISERTYEWLWRNIYAICDYPRLVKMFWANSYQYFDFRLKYIDGKYDQQTFLLTNQDEIDNRKKERERFLEFHFALGGLILYRKKFEVLEYMFSYSQSIPPRYVLLPESMTEIFKWFELIRNEFNYKGKSIDIKYSFPELDNLGNNQQIKFWICSYISLLFVRLYSLQKHLSFQNFTGQPVLPDDIIELNNWLDSVSYFDHCLKRVIENKDLIETVGLSHVVSTNQKAFELFINELKSSISDKIGAQKLNAQLSNDKIKSFKTQSNTIIKNALQDYDSVFSNVRPTEDTDNIKLSVNGSSTLMSKSSFTEGDIPSLNFDTVFAEGIRTHKIRRLIPNAFMIGRTERYLLNIDNLIEGISNVIGQLSNIEIIAFGAGYHLKQRLEGSKFKEFVKFMPSSELRDVVFVLKEDDLPYKEIIDLKKEEIEELQLDIINDQLKLYASVIDINLEENNKLKAKWASHDEPESLDLKVLIAISFIQAIHWKKERQVIQIDIDSAYKEQGMQSELSEIKSIE